MEEKELLTWVKEELIYKRLKLSEMGINISEVGDDTALFNEEGLNLDSIDGLELAVGIEQKFGIKIGKLTENIAKEKFANAKSIADYILELQGQLAVSN